MLPADEIGRVSAAPVRCPWKPGEGTLVTLWGGTDLPRGIIPAKLTWEPVKVVPTVRGS